MFWAFESGLCNEEAVSDLRKMEPDKVIAKFLIVEMRIYFGIIC